MEEKFYNYTYNLQYGFVDRIRVKELNKLQAVKRVERAQEGSDVKLRLLCEKF